MRHQSSPLPPLRLERAGSGGSSGRLPAAPMPPLRRGSGDVERPVTIGARPTACAASACAQCRAGGNTLVFCIRPYCQKEK